MVDKNKVMKILDKIERFKSVNLDISELEPNEDGNIQCLAFDFTWSKYILYEEAKELVLNGEAQVHSSNTVYMLGSDTKRNSTLRKFVRIRDNEKCHYCGEFGGTVDHIIPVSEGGKESLDNMICSCQVCNVAKDKLSYGDFIKLIKQKGVEYVKNEFIHENKNKKKPKGFNKNGIPYY